MTLESKYEKIFIIRAIYPELGRLRQEDCKFKANLDYTVRLCQDKKEQRMRGREGERKGERER